MSFSRRSRTHDEIPWRVLGVWVLTFSSYFNCCPFYLDIPNLISPPGDQLMFKSRKRNLSEKQVWALSFFSEGNISKSFVHISTVTWRCWFNSALFTIFCNQPTNIYSLELFTEPILFNRIFFQRNQNLISILRVLNICYNK